MENIEKLVRERKSVRSYDGRAVTDQDREKLDAFIKTIENPYGIPVEFRFLDAKEHGLTSPVVSGTELYVGAKLSRTPHGEEAYGYAFEKLVLYAQSLGIGTVWIGGTMNRAAFEKAMELGEGEMMPCVSPLGYPAAKLSIKESLMRKAIKADDRRSFETLFFDGSFGTPLTPEKAGAMAMPLEMVRWAPSAVNKQPWRVVKVGDAAHFYLKRNKGFINSATGDLQKIDLGIALCHFDLACRESGSNGELVLSDPGIPTEADVEYIATYRVGK